MEPTKPGLIFLNPVFQKKIWGGRQLQSEFGYSIPTGGVGECWAISAHENGDCTVRGGEFDSMKLSELYATHRDLFGYIKDEKFPLLVKIIDAAQDLSIQVHPDDEYAAEHENGSLGKRECWYVLDAKPGATIIAGQKAANKEEFLECVKAGRWSDIINDIPVAKGDFLQINPGYVHAIKAGTLLLETQQSSDITYRVYDYDRVQSDGTLRDLHLSQSLDVIDFDAQPMEEAFHPEVNTNEATCLVECSKYTVDTVLVDGDFVYKNNNPFVCVSVIDGKGKIGHSFISKGDHLIVPSGYGDIEFSGDMHLVLSHV